MKPIYFRCCGKFLDSNSDPATTARELWNQFVVTDVQQHYIDTVMHHEIIDDQGRTFARNVRDLVGAFQ